MDIIFIKWSDICIHFKVKIWNRPNQKIACPRRSEHIGLKNLTPSQRHESSNNWMMGTHIFYVIYFNIVPYHWNDSYVALTFKLSFIASRAK